MSKRLLSVVTPGTGGNAVRKALRVVIADDVRDLAEILALVLREDGNEVHVALRGDDALDVCRLFRPDVVIADVNMPGASGYALARELRQRHGNLAPLLIAISGIWTSTTDRSLGRAVGFDYYLAKPCDVKEIIRLIEPLRRGAADSAPSAA